MHIFCNLVFVVTLAIAAPEYRNTLDRGDANDILDQTGEVFSGQPQNSILHGPNPPPSAESATGRSDLTAFNVPDTDSVNNADNNPLQKIAATFKYDEPGKSPDTNIPSLPPPQLPKLQDTSQCTQVTDGCIPPDQTPFEKVKKVEGLSCSKISPTMIGNCKVCNAKLQCASASFKCFWLDKETPTIFADPAYQFKTCHLCVDFWTSDLRCSGELKTLPWRITDEFTTDSVADAGNDLSSRDIATDLNIVSTFNFEEDEEKLDNIRTNPQSQLNWVNLQDTSQCVELKDECIPNQKPFQKLEKPRGISCNYDEGFLVDCKKCNEKEQCASMSFKCPNQEKEAPSVYPETDGEFAKCQLCVDFWTSDSRCTDVLSKTVYHILWADPYKPLAWVTGLQNPYSQAIEIFLHNSYQKAAKKRTYKYPTHPEVWNNTSSVRATSLTYSKEPYPVSFLKPVSGIYIPYPSFTTPNI